MSSTLKVLQVIPKLGYGGAETGCYDIAHYLPENNCESFIVTSGGELLKFIDSQPSLKEAIDKLKLGETFEQKLDWPLRYGHMRVHTALHLLSVVIPLGVTGGSIGSVKGRLDFEMPEPLENKELIEDQLNDLIMR